MISLKIDKNDAKEITRTKLTLAYKACTNVNTD